MRSTAGQSGFTLLEIMVALVVFGFLLIGLTQGVQFGLRAITTQTAMIDQRGDLDAVDTALRNLVEPLDPGGAGAVMFVGQPHAVAFTTELPEAAAAAGDRHADVALGVDAGHDLVLRYTPHLHANRLAGSAAIQSDVLVGGVARIDCGYWRADGRWVTRWDQPTPPALLRIDIVLMDDRHWPAIVIAPMRQPAG